MNDEYLKGWLIKANNDVRVAKLIVEKSPEDLITDVICFHSQQAIEKFLKSFLISQDLEFEPSHNLEYLQDLSSGVDPKFKSFKFDVLSNYSVTVRYGEDFYLPSDKEALDAYNLATEVKSFILQKLNVTEDDLKL